MATKQRNLLARRAEPTTSLSVTVSTRDRLRYLAEEFEVHASVNVPVPSASRLLALISLGEIVEKETDLYGDPVAFTIRVRLDPDARD